MGGTIKGTSKQKAIRRKCTDCMQNTVTGRCKEKSCQLYEYREGHRPKTENSEDGIIQPKKVLSPEQLKKMLDGRVKHQNLASKTLAETPILIKRKKRHIKV